MTAAPAGRVVGIYYDSTARLIPGTTFLRTSTTGRIYRVIEVRIQQTGKNTGRQHLRCEVMPADFTPDADDDVRPIAWYRRDKKRGRP